MKDEEEVTAEARSGDLALKGYIFVAPAGGVVTHRTVRRKSLAHKRLQRRPSRRIEELCDNARGPRNDSRRSTQDHF